MGGTGEAWVSLRRQEVAHSLPRVGKKGRRQVLVDKTGKGSWKIMEDNPNKDDKVMINTLPGDAFEFLTLLQSTEENVTMLF